MRVGRWVIAALAVVAAIQASLLLMVDRRIAGGAFRGSRKGRIADAPLSTFGSGRPRLDMLLSSATLSEIAGSHRCSVFMFFTSTCQWLRPIGSRWNGVNALEIAGEPVPVHWIAIHPGDVAARDSASAVAGVLKIHWMTTTFAAAQRGISLVPRAWVVGRDLRVYGTAQDPTDARRAIEECGKAEAK